MGGGGGKNKKSKVSTILAQVVYDKMSLRNNDFLARSFVLYNGITYFIKILQAVLK